MKTYVPTYALAPLLSAALLAACGGGSDTAAVATVPTEIELRFAAVAGGAPVGCGPSSIAALGTTGAAAQLKDLRFYISNAAMVKADGTEVPLVLGANDSWNLTVGDDRVTLIDLEDATGACPAATGTAATNAVLRGTVPTGAYTGVKLTMGVPFALNHSLWSDPITAQAPLDIQAMAWSWQGGRKFAKIELADPLATAPAGTAGKWVQPANGSYNSFNMHLGSTGCNGDASQGTLTQCNAPNRMQFTLAAFDPATQNIALDVAALLEGSDITRNTEGTAAGCMSFLGDPECAAIFEQLAIDWTGGTGLPIQGGAAQSVFKAVAK